MAEPTPMLPVADCRLSRIHCVSAVSLRPSAGLSLHCSSSNRYLCRRKKTVGVATRNACRRAVGASTMHSDTMSRKCICCEGLCLG